MVSRNAKPTIRQILFVCVCVCVSWLSLGLVVWPRLGDLFVFQNLREFCASHSPEFWFVHYYYYYYMWVFRLVMVIFSSLSGKKFLQFSNTLLSIRAQQWLDWMIPNLPLFTSVLRTVPWTPTTIGITVTFKFFSPLTRFKNWSSFFFPSLSVRWSAKSTRWIVLFFLFIKMRSHLLGDPFWYQEHFLLLIFWDRFSFVHIPLIGMVKFKSFAQFPVDHLSHPVKAVSFISFVPVFYFHLLCNCFISITT